MSDDESDSVQYNPITKALENPKSKVLAIKAMCAHCMGCTADHLEPGWREEVRNCTASKCPLFNHRPFK